jgi:hypothetical protein
MSAPKATDLVKGVHKGADETRPPVADEVVSPRVRLVVVSCLVFFFPSLCWPTHRVQAPAPYGAPASEDE